MATTVRIGGGVTVASNGRAYASKGVKITLEGTTPREIAAAVDRLGKLPASAMTSSVKRGAAIVRRVARSLAPRDSGDLRRGIVVRGRKERTSGKGKTVYDVWMSPAMSDVFVKLSRAGKRYYYPGSMEYGYRTASGGRWEGLHYLRRAAETTLPVYEPLVLDTLSRKLDQLWAKQQSGGGQT